MVLSAFLGVQFKTERIVDTTMLPLSMINGVDSYALVQIPLFILAGELMNRGGLTLRLIDWSQAHGRPRARQPRPRLDHHQLHHGGRVRLRGRRRGGDRQAADPGDEARRATAKDSPAP